MEHMTDAERELLLWVSDQWAEVLAHRGDLRAEDGRAKIAAVRKEVADRQFEVQR